MEEEFFTETEHTNQSQLHQQLTQTPPSFQEPLQSINAEYTHHQFQPIYDPPTQVAEATDPDNDFNQYEEDDTARRIRQDEERIQTTLQERSEREWQEKQARKEEGRKQLAEFQAKKEEEVVRRKEQNVVRESEARQEAGKVHMEGWKKVVGSINVRQGESKRDNNRMREAILHRRQDEKR